MHGVLNCFAPGTAVLFVKAGEDHLDVLGHVHAPGVIPQLGLLIVGGRKESSPHAHKEGEGHLHVAYLCQRQNVSLMKKIPADQKSAEAAWDKQEAAQAIEPVKEECHLLPKVVAYFLEMTVIRKVAEIPDGECRPASWPHRGGFQRREPPKNFSQNVKK